LPHSNRGDGAGFARSERTERKSGQVSHAGQMPCPVQPGGPVSPAHGTRTVSYAPMPYAGSGADGRGRAPGVRCLERFVSSNGHAAPSGTRQRRPAPHSRLDVIPVKPGVDAQVPCSVGETAGPAAGGSAPHLPAGAHAGRFTKTDARWSAVSGQRGERPGGGRPRRQTRPPTGPRPGPTVRMASGLASRPPHQPRPDPEGPLDDAFPQRSTRRRRRTLNWLLTSFARPVTDIAHASPSLGGTD